MRSGFGMALLCIGVGGCATPRTYLESSPVRISEFHFAPSPTEGRAEFIEIRNVSGERVELSGWQVTGAGRVALPAGTVLEPGRSIVVCQSEAACKKAFGPSVPIATTAPGKLDNKGETIRVEDPQGRVADEIRYDPSMPEVEKARGTGLSVHCTDPGGGLQAGKPTPGK